MTQNLSRNFQQHIEFLCHNYYGNLSQLLTTIHHIITGNLSQLVMAIITGHSPCMDKEFQHSIDIHRFCITCPLDMMMMMVGGLQDEVHRIPTKETLNYPVYYNLSLCCDSHIIIILLVRCISNTYLNINKYH